MAETVRLINPDEIKRNREHPRVIFRQEELDALQDSISKNGILVPLTVFQDGKQFFLLDGERRWRCALKLGLPKVPVIVQPKPDKLQNIMMMFAIHNARKDWDPFPTALKLEELEKEFTKIHRRNPTEEELGGIASLSRGEVRRLKKLLALPEDYREELMEELNKPRSKQEITDDHVLEATKGAEALRKRSVIDEKTEDQLRKAIIAKFRTKVINNTVAPRKLVKLAQAVEREEVSESMARTAIKRIIDEPEYSIDTAFSDTVEKVDFEHSVEQLSERLLAKLDEHKRRKYEFSESLQQALKQLARQIQSLW